MKSPFLRIWLFIDLAAATILWFSALVLAAMLAIGGILSSKTGQSNEDLLFFYAVPSALSFIVSLVLAAGLPQKFFLFIGTYSLAERTYRAWLTVLEKMPGPKWLWTLGVKGALADSIAFQMRNEDAENIYKEVGDLSQAAGPAAPLLAGASLENYADRLARQNRMLDYAEWKGKFRGANIARRLMSLLWLMLVVLVAQQVLGFVTFHLPISASTLGYLGQYRSADVLLRISRYLDDIRGGANYEFISERLAQNSARWGNLDQSKIIYDQLLAGYGWTDNEGLPQNWRNLLHQGDSRLRDISKGALSLYVRLREDKKARKLAEQLYLPEDPKVDASGAIRYADVLIGLNEPAQAVDYLSKVLPLPQMKGESQQTMLLLARGNAYTAAHNFTEAEKDLRKALSLAEANGSEEPTRLVGALLGLSQVLVKEGGLSQAPVKNGEPSQAPVKNGEKTEAGKLLARASDTISGAKIGAGSLAAAGDLAEVGRIYKECKMYSEAKKSFEKSIEMVQDKTSGNNPALAVLYLNLGEIELDRGDNEAALAQFERAKKLIERNHLPVEHPAVVRSWIDFARVSELLARSDAPAYRKKAMDLLATEPHLKTAEIQSLLSAYFSINE